MRQANATGERNRIHWAKIFLLFVYLSVFPFLPALNNPNENTRVYLTLALVDFETFHLDSIVRRYGWTNDMARVPGLAGTSHYAAAKGPFIAYLGVPVYAVQRALGGVFGQRPPSLDAPASEAAQWLKKTTFVLQFFCIHLPSGLFLLSLERRLRRWSADPTLRLSAVAAVGLGTNFLAYSFSFVSHAWSTIAVFFALDTIGRERLRSRGDPRRASPRTAFFAGLLAGWPTLLEYQGVVLSLILGIYGISIFYKSRTFFVFVAGALLDVFLLLLFQWKSFGSPWKTGVTFMETAAFRTAWQEGFFGFSSPHKDALSGLLFHGGFGLLTTSPWLWLGVLGAFLPALAWWRRRACRERRGQILVATMMFWALVLLMASNSMWRGGWTIGPRYLGAAPGLLVIPGLALAETLARRGRREPARILAGTLTLTSFLRGGLIGLLVVTLPESIERPLLQIVLPFVRDNVAPHHLAELIGIHPLWPWRISALAALSVVLLAVVASYATLAVRFLRVCWVMGLAALLLVPALRLPEGVRDDGPAVRTFFRSIWVPHP